LKAFFIGTFCQKGLWYVHFNLNLAEAGNIIKARILIAMSAAADLVKNGTKEIRALAE